MADQQKRDDTPSPNPAVPDPHAGTTREEDFGRTDRYATRDEDAVRNLGDDTAWDSGRGGSIGHGTHSENDVRSADAGTPGVKTRSSDSN
jgi:hypothetical protein